MPRGYPLGACSGCLLESVIQIAIGSVDHLTTEHPAYGTRISIMAVCSYPYGSLTYGSLTNNLSGLGEAALAAFMSRFSESMEFTRLPSPKGYPVNGSVQVAPLPANRAPSG